MDSDENPFYSLDFRVVRFQITETAYEYIITNLAAEAFPAEEIKKLYGMRWGIERSFRTNHNENRYKAEKQKT